MASHLLRKFGSHSLRLDYPGTWHGSHSDGGARMKHIIGFNIVIGIWLAAAPLIAGSELFSPARAWNNLFLGLIVVGAAAMVLADMPGPTAWSCGSLLAGVGLLVAPLVLPYRDHAFRNDAIPGVLILLISAGEISWCQGRAHR
jgi:hypothetical protein